jgi:hypothetical protein
MTKEERDKERQLFIEQFVPKRRRDVLSDPFVAYIAKRTGCEMHRRDNQATLAWWRATVGDRYIRDRLDLGSYPYPANRARFLRGRCEWIVLGHVPEVFAFAF